MEKKKEKNKKVNHLKLNECEEILKRIQNQKDSHYYQHVLIRYRSLLPSHADAVTLSRLGSVSAATFGSTYDHKF